MAQQRKPQIPEAEILPSTPEDRAFRELKLKAIGSLNEFFDAKERGRDDIAVARVAAASLSAATRYEQTQGASRALDWAMARDLARDKEQLENYIRVTMPNASIVKALPPAAK